MVVSTRFATLCEEQTFCPEVSTSPAALEASNLLNAITALRTNVHCLHRFNAPIAAIALSMAIKAEASDSPAMAPEAMEMM